MRHNQQDMSAYIAELSAIDTTTLPADGGERFNRLIFAKSPYLLQHAENPVEWYEWGEAAFARARDENRPVLLSIGYATCHWCHVMAHESFEDAEVAALLNRHFVCIKVDREERPDIDDFYMAVSQALTGSGGWPLNVFLAPDKRPFLAVTYLPKHGRQGMSGLMDLLANIALLWRQEPDRIERNCRAIMEGLGAAREDRDSGQTADTARIADLARQQLARLYDPVHGGFGRAPKFPMPTYLLWLLEQGDAGDREARDMALHTLRHIWQGGIWDQLAGGVHRYAVDREWLVPHFEKMLYDQAMLALTALAACRGTADPALREMAGGLLTSAVRELGAPDGGFHSALDADSEGVEGRYYVWSAERIAELLGPDAGLFGQYHGVTPGGNFEGVTILTQAGDLAAFCRERGLDPADTDARLARCRALLLAERERRIRPLCDRKIITAWNGLMIAALARGATLLDAPDHLRTAEAAARFVLTRLRRPDGRLVRCYRDGASDIPGFLEDYAYLTFGLVELYEATLADNWLAEALGLAHDLLRLFRSPDGATWTQTGSDAEQMPLPLAADRDGVIPAPLATAGRVLLRLARISGDDRLEEGARSIADQLAPELARTPLDHLGALTLHERLAAAPITADIRAAEGTPLLHEFLRLLKSRPLPGLVLRAAADAGPAGVSLCGAGACHPPAATPAELAALLDRLAG